MADKFEALRQRMSNLEDELGKGELDVGEGQVDEVEVGILKEGMVGEVVVEVVMGDVWEKKLVNILEGKMEKRRFENN